MKHRLQAPGVPHTARSRPAAPPVSESTTLSVRNWRAIRERGAPRRQPHGNLLPPRGRARQRQIRDVCAGDQQHHADRSQQYLERGRHASDGFFGQRFDTPMHPDVGVWIRRGETAADLIDFRLRALRVAPEASRPNTRSECSAPGLAACVRNATDREEPIFRLGHPERREIEDRRHHADHGVALAVEQDLLADSAIRRHRSFAATERSRAPGRCSFPGRNRCHRTFVRGSARRRVAGTSPSLKCKPRICSGVSRPVRLALHTSAAPMRSKECACCAHIKKVGGRDRIAARAKHRVTNRSGSRYGRGCNRTRVHDRKDGRVGPDSQRQGKHRDRRHGAASLAEREWRSEILARHKVDDSASIRLT